MYERYREAEKQRDFLVHRLTSERVLATADNAHLCPPRENPPLFTNYTQAAADAAAAAAAAAAPRLQALRPPPSLHLNADEVLLHDPATSRRYVYNLRNRRSRWLNENSPLPSAQPPRHAPGAIAVPPREPVQAPYVKTTKEANAQVMAKHKYLLDRLQKKLGRQECSLKSDIPKAISFLFTEYPPLDDSEKGKRAAEKVWEKLNEKDFKSALKQTKFLYHPDKNREDNVGYEHHVMCEEVTKLVTDMSSRLLQS